MSGSTDPHDGHGVATVELRQVPTALYWQVTAHTDALVREFALLAATSGDDRPVPARLTNLMSRTLAQYGSYDERARQEVLQATERGERELTVTYTMPTSFSDVGAQLIELWEEADAYCRAGVDLLTLAAPAEATAFRRWFVEEFLRQMAGEPPRSWIEYSAAHAPPADQSIDLPERVVDSAAEGPPVLVLRGEIDLETAPALRTELQQLRDAGATTIVVDASAVDFLDSVGISVLIAARQRLVDDGGGLLMRSPSRQVSRTLRTAGLGAWFGLDD